MAADDGVLAPARHERLDEAELPDRPFEAVELLLADLARVRGIGMQLVDGDLLDGEGRERGLAQ